MTTTTVARTWSIERKDGLRLGFTDHDRSLSFEGMSFRPDAGMTANALVQGLGLAVDNTEAEGALSDTAISEVDLIAGRWDGATVRMWEVDWQDVDRRRVLFRGTLGEVTRSAGAFRAELRGLTEPLNAPLGRVFRPRCAACLGDRACGMNLAHDTYRFDGVVDGHIDAQVFRFGGFPAFDAGWFEHGTLQILGGDALGLKSVVKNDMAKPGGVREIELWEPLAIVPNAGDAVRMIAGCDKRPVTCRLKFNNFLNFRGFPHLPSEDWLMTPQSGGRHE